MKAKTEICFDSVKNIYYFRSKARVQNGGKGVVQCDQMARFFDQYKAVYSNKNLPNSIKTYQRMFIILSNTS